MSTVHVGEDDNLMPAYRTTPDEEEQLKQLAGKTKSVAHRRAIMALILGWTPFDVEELRFIAEDRSESAARTAVLAWTQAYVDGDIAG